MLRKRHILLGIILVYLSLEIVSVLGLYLVEKFRQVTYKPYEYKLSDTSREDIEKYISGKRGIIIHDPELGWTLRPEASNGFETVNAQGIRSLNEYSTIPGDETIRLSAFGDSYVFCCEVKNSDSWEDKLAQKFLNIEVLNYGVGGYGLDQSFLRYKREGSENGSHIVLIGFFSNYFKRNVSVFPPVMHARTGRRSLPFTKPRYTFYDEQLVLLENPLPTLMDYEAALLNDKTFLDKIEESDHYLSLWYRKGGMDFLPSVRLFKLIRYGFAARRPENRIVDTNNNYCSSSTAFRITLALMDDFYMEVLKNRALPVYLFFPYQEEVSRYLGDQIKSYQPLIDCLNEKGYRYIDLLNAFEEQGGPVDLNILFEKGGHYSPTGNKLVADYLADYLTQNELLDHDSIKRSIREDAATVLLEGR